MNKKDEMEGIVMDLHTHTVMSGHAFSTLQEMVEGAKRKGIRVLGISEHGPAIPGTCELIYFRNYRVIPEVIDGLRVVKGAELNILDYKGTLDLPEDMYQYLDFVIAGLHSLCYTAGSVKDNTDAILGAMHNAHVNIISHPIDGTGEVDIEALVKASRETGTLLEANNSSLDPRRMKTVAGPNTLKMLELCKRYDTPVILGSDAHISYSIADYSRLEPLMEQTGFPDELIVNRHPELFGAFTGNGLDFMQA